MPGLETLAADQTIKDILTGDATLDAILNGRVYENSVPDETPMPYVLLDDTAAEDIKGVGGIRMMVDTVYLVRAVANTDNYDSLKPIAIRIDQLLEGVSRTDSDGYQITVDRIGPYRLTEQVGSRTFRSLGGTYRIWITQTVREL